MAPFLLRESLAQRLHQLVEAQLLDFRPLFGAQILFGQPAQPFLRQLLGLDRGRNREHPLERVREDDIEPVEVALVLDQQRARKPIKLVDRPLGEIAFQRPHEIEILARSDRYVRLAQIGEESQKHRPRF